MGNGQIRDAPSLITMMFNNPSESWHSRNGGGVRRKVVRYSSSNQQLDRKLTGNEPTGSSQNTTSSFTMNCTSANSLVYSALIHQRCLTPRFIIHKTMENTKQSNNSGRPSRSREAEKVCRLV